ncbi:unnamed protein product [Caenorhabditis auriculariae]|uniref:Uncharacterized protein n=1 Tax=Caenorhabditis auriculariae TaxID=2777116 RepID=A0A8S1HFA1_9PELO|nr:unnamed protein product [Caenorhabditis auriculariae]
MSSSNSDSLSTVHYAKPVIIRKASMFSKASISVSQDSSEKNQNTGIVYPRLLIKDPGSPQHSQSTRSDAYAVPHASSAKLSFSQLKYENIKHRCKMIEEENQRLLRFQSDVVNDANRRVEMHVNEIRMLKEENKKLLKANKELRDLCCFLDDDRQKTRRLAREWQKFGRFTSNLMKQEVQTYQQKQNELEERCAVRGRENEELKQLCLYLDEQRQLLANQFNQCHRDDDRSEDLGCGSSERSVTFEEENCSFNKTKEDAIRLLSKRMSLPSTSSITEEGLAPKKDSTLIISYIQSLENRIKNLESLQNNESFWNSESNIGSDSDEKTVIERWDEENTSNGNSTTRKSTIQNMFTSTTSTMTSSGTTYGSSETDGESAVFVMGDEIDFGSLEVRALSRIDEEKSEMANSRDKTEENVVEKSGEMPPAIAPISRSLLSIAHFSMKSPSTSTEKDSLTRSASETFNSWTSAPRSSIRCSSVGDENEFPEN